MEKKVVSRERLLDLSTDLLKVIFELAGVTDDDLLKVAREFSQGRISKEVIQEYVDLMVKDKSKAKGFFDKKPISSRWKVTQKGITVPCPHRSHLCPDHSCDVLWTDYSKFSFDRGLSHFCIGRAYGAAGLVFTERKTIHENDLCKCIYTPLKGMIRYFTCLEDFILETTAMLRVMDKLNPLKCDFCHQDVERLSAVLTVMKDGKKKCYRCIAKEEVK